ncbi:MAG TPA: VWA domain-containing protein [Acidobacteriota bacterium]|nr:VWA domain-containing protein [Acidobacteriota bacterium]
MRIPAVPTLLLMLSGVFAICAGVMAGQKKPEATDEDQTIRVQTDLFEIRAVVTDRRGNLIENLRLEDFELLQDGEPQEISFFSIVEAAASGEPDAEADAAPVGAPAGQKSLGMQLNEPSPRTAMLYVDNLHLDFQNLNWVKQNLHRFIDENMTPQDMIAIVTSDGSLGIAQQFTRDRQVLRAAIDRIKLGYIAQATRFTPYLASLVDMLNREAHDLACSILIAEGDWPEGQECTSSMLRGRAQQVLYQASWRRESTLRNLRGLVEQLSEMPGQRMVVIFSDGFSQHGRDGLPVYEETQAAITTATRSGVVFYSVDAKGLQTPMDDRYLGGHPILEYSRNESLTVLSSLARDTGGELFLNTNNFGRVISRALDNNRYYYVLSYYPKLRADSETFHRIDVRVPNHPEYRVRTARGFTPADLLRDDDRDADPRKRLIRQIQTAAVKSEIGVSARMDFIQDADDDRQASLTVYIDAGRLTYRSDVRRNTFAIEIIYLIYNADGSQVESQSVEVEGNLSPERLGQALENGYKFSRRLQLKPGVYQARIGVREKETGLMGTTSAWVEIPDIRRSRIAVSSLAFNKPLSAGPDTAFDVNSGGLKQVRILHGVPLYQQGESFDFSFHIYHREKTFAGADLEVRTELFHGGKSVMDHPWRKLSFDPNSSGGADWITVKDSLDLSGFTPGLYELKISVRDRKLKKNASRAAMLGIE